MRMALAPLALAVFVSQAPAADSARDNITIIGSRSEARELPGSAALIDEEQIQVEAATDVNQLLKTVTGTYVREEDGHGLRPNVGIRAASSARSGKITLMEDGVMMAPAPYSNPAAYYFPTTLRMSGVEVLKGASLLRYGPQTTGGVINLVSSAIPQQTGGEVAAMVGQYGQRDLHARYGGQADQLGWLVETAQRQSEGFKDLDRSNGDTGYDIEDYHTKLSWEGDGQRLLLKMQYSAEVSDETYLGLTDADFDDDPSRRYGLSAIDQMDNDHQGYSINYELDLAEGVTANVLAYHNEFSRDWFKLSGGGALVEAANAGDTDSAAILRGKRDMAGLNYKHNSRDYESSGVELNLDATLGAHRLEMGARQHADEMDRFQPVEIYDQVDGRLQFQSVQLPSGGNNRLEGADATAFWLTDQWQATPALKINMALRHEAVDSWRRQYADPDRTVLDGRRGNRSREWLPGTSFTYDVNERWQVLAGVHRGFSPLGGGAQSHEDPEVSINYEAGLRFHWGELFAEAIAFRSDFDNKSENCSMAQPCSNGATSGSYSTGDARVNGLELQMGHYLALDNGGIPFEFSYTYTDAALTESDPFSNLRRGDALANIPSHTAALRLGLEHDSGWNNHAVVKYADTMCVAVGCNEDGGGLDETDSYLVMDLVSRYQLAGGAEAFLKLENMLDEQAIVSRTPDGARPNKPRTASVGMEYRF